MAGKRVWVARLLWLSGGAGTLLVLAAQIPPEQATSNLAAWARVFGLDQIPEWLASAQIDAYATILGALLALTTTVLALSLYSGVRKTRAMVREMMRAINAKIDHEK